MEHHGPLVERVLVDPGGTAVSPERAEAEHGITQDKVAVIFIRDDGWSLGATHELADDAYRLWKDEWKWFAVRPSPLRFPIKRWPEHQRLRARARALTWEDLDPLVCMSCGNEDHPHGVLYLYGKCHPDAPQEVLYEKATGTLRTRCAECKKVTGGFLVGGRCEVGREFEEGP